MKLVQYNSRFAIAVAFAMALALAPNANAQNSQTDIYFAKQIWNGKDAPIANGAMVGPRIAPSSNVVDASTARRNWLNRSRILWPEKCGHVNRIPNAANRNTP